MKHTPSDRRTALTKIRTPLLSMSATGSLSDSVTLQHTGAGQIARSKPTPTNPRSLKQTYQRWLYQWYTIKWSELSAAQKAAYESDARPHHMTGFAWYMSVMLSTMPDFVAIYHMDERSGSLVADFSKNLNHASAFGTTPVIGYIDWARFLDGAVDYIRAPSSTPLALTNKGFIFARLQSTFNGGQVILMKYAGGGAPGYYMNITRNAGSELSFAVYTPTGLSWAHGDATWWDGSWHSFMLDWNGTTQAYFDTDPIGALGANQLGSTANASFLYLGCANDLSTKMTGNLDEIIILNCNTTQAQRDHLHSRRYPLN